MFKKYRLKQIIWVKIPVIIAFPAFVAILAITYWLLMQYLSKEPNGVSTESISYSNSTQGDYKHKLPSGQLVFPILFNDFVDESAELAPLKSAAQTVCASYYSKSLTDAAVYYFDFASLDWFGINTEQQFMPGSLMKIVTAIALLKRSESNPEILQERLVFTQADNLNVGQTLTHETLHIGASYSVAELLELMLSHSDNHATFLLTKLCGIEALRKTYTDFNVEMPHSADYKITLHQYVRFFKALFYAAYLNKANSSKLLEYLSHSSFKNGIELRLNGESGLIMSHKFGERDYNGVFELHDVGIVYRNESAYLVGIMAKGKNRPELEMFIGAVSEAIAKKS